MENFAFFPHLRAISGLFLHRQFLGLVWDVLISSFRSPMNLALRVGILTLWFPDDNVTLQNGIF